MPLPAHAFRIRAFAALATLGFCAVGAQAQFNYTETFKTGTASGWDFYTGNTSPGPRLTSGAAPSSGDPEYGVSSQIDPSGQGWLRLATTTGNQANAAYFDTALPSLNNNIAIKFSVAMWGDNGIDSGGDGITFFMRDASTPLSVGAFGGSIGYAQQNGGLDGVSGGYFGVALDVYGNYSNPTEGRLGGPGFRPNAVVARGPGDGQTGYNYLSGTSGYNYTATGGATTKDAGDPAVAALPYSLSAPTATSRPNQTLSYRNVEIDLSSSSQLTVKLQFGEDGIWRTVLTADMSSFARPDMMSFGFSSGTGGANQVYEIGNSFSVTASASSNTYFWDNGATSNKGIWGTTGDAEKNWTSDVLPGSKTNVIFNDAYVTQNQTVTMTTSRTVGSMYFSGQYGYTIGEDTTGRKITFDAPTGISYLSVTNSSTGSANNTIGVDVQLNNALEIDNYAAGRSLTFTDNVIGGGNDLTVKGAGTTNFNFDVSGVGTLTKLDGGVLSFATTAVAANVVLGGGTLRLDSATLTAGNLHITGDSILDFGTGGASTLNLTSLTIDAGVTLTVLNWTNALDHFYATNSPTAGALSQIVFAGFTSPTGWRTGEIRPVPEPATYGALFIGALLAAFAGFRWHQEKLSAERRLVPIPVRRRHTQIF